MYVLKEWEAVKGKVKHHRQCRDRCFNERAESNAIKSRSSGGIDSAAVELALQPVETNNATVETDSSTVEMRSAAVELDSATVELALQVIETASLNLEMPWNECFLVP
jgi:hypothetical protein